MSLIHAACADRWRWPRAPGHLGVSARETENWPSFRGPAALAVADDDPRLPVTSSPRENVAWKTPIEGLGWSSPVVWGNRVFLTTVVSDGPSRSSHGALLPLRLARFRRDADQGGRPQEREKDVHHWLVYAVDFDSGGVVWKTEVNAEPPSFDRHLKNTYASETPGSDGERIYAYFGNVGVFALDMSGKKVWERRLSRRPRASAGAPDLAGPRRR